MSALVLHVLPGILAGALFRLQTLMILASAVLVAAAVFFMQSGLLQACPGCWSAGGSSMLERPGVAAQSIRQSTEN